MSYIAPIVSTQIITDPVIIGFGNNPVESDISAVFNPLAFGPKGRDRFLGSMGGGAAISGRAVGTGGGDGEYSSDPAVREKAQLARLQAFIMDCVAMSIGRDSLQSSLFSTALNASLQTLRKASPKLAQASTSYSEASRSSIDLTQAWLATDPTDTAALAAAAAADDFATAARNDAHTALVNESVLAKDDLVVSTINAIEDGISSDELNSAGVTAHQLAADAVYYALQSERDNIERRRDNLDERRADGEISDEEYAAYMAVIEADQLVLSHMDDGGEVAVPTFGTSLLVNSSLNMGSPM